MCNLNNYHKILSFYKHKKKFSNKSLNIFIMPYSLKQLEGRRDSCIKKIQEFKESAKERGALELGELTFNSVVFFSSLIDMKKQDIDSFLSFFPQLPRILEIARQAAIEEKRRRKFEVAIDKYRKERRMKHKRFIEGEEKKETYAVSSYPCFGVKFTSRNGSNNLSFLPLTFIYIFLNLSS